MKEEQQRRGCALITGASSGIGEALAHLLHAQGYTLILAGRSKERLAQIAQAVQAETTIIADLRDRGGRQQLISLIRSRLPDLVVNNAGFGIYGDALSISVNDQLSILEVNAAAALELTLETVRALAQAGKGGIVVNVSSVAGEFPCPGMSVYGASKAFLTHVSEALQTELAGKGIHVLVSCPGMVATDFAHRAAKKTVSLEGGPIMTPQKAAEEIWWQIKKKREKHIFNWQYRLASLLALYFAPRSLVKKIIWNRIKQRI